jgi:LemA protein
VVPVYLGIAAVVLLVLLLAGGVAVIYNGLVRRKLEAENAWSHIDVQLKRRYDLIPNLVETVKGYAGHEKETLAKVIEARNGAVNARGQAEASRAETHLAGTLKSLFAVAEAYPELRANQHFQELQEELKGTENRIGFARQYYNDMAGQYNSARQRFPSNVVASALGFRPVDFFQFDPAEAAQARQSPQVKL